MPRTLTVKCDRCGKDFKIAKQYKKWRHHRFEGKTFRQRPSVYCSMECLHD